MDIMKLRGFCSPLNCSINNVAFDWSKDEIFDRIRSIFVRKQGISHCVTTCSVPISSDNSESGI